MSPYHSFVAFWLVSCSTAAVFHRRGSANETAPYYNVTATTSLSSVVTSTFAPESLLSSSPPYPTQIGGTVSSSGYQYTQAAGTVSPKSPHPTIFPNAKHPVPSIIVNSTLSEAGPWSNTTSSASKHVSNASCTVHVPSASIDWWYPPTYSHLLGTMTTEAANFTNADSYTLVTHTATFDVASALESNFACVNSASVISQEGWEYTITLCVDYTMKPTAAATSLAYRTAAAPFPPGGVIPVSDANLYDLYNIDDLPSATIPISIAPNRTFIETSATPFVHFTAYEVESGNKTETVQLASAYVYPYWLKGIENDVTATGPLPDEFLQQIPESDCDSGQLQAVVTVVIVVDLFYENRPNLDPFIIHFESTALGFEDPPVIINNEGTSRPQPFTMDDWGLPGVPARQTTPISIMPDVRPAPAPMPTQANNNNNQAAGSDEAQVPNVPQPTQVTVGAIGTIPVVIGPSLVVVVGSQTLQPGGPAIIVGGVTPVSLAPSATAIVVGGISSQLPQLFNPPAQESVLVVTRPPQIVVGGSTITALPTQGAPGVPNNNPQNNPGSGPTFVVGGQTLAPGGQAITISGTTLSLAPGGSSVIINGVTSAVANPPVGIAQPSITVGSSIFTPLPGSGNTFIIADQTLAPGGQPITVSGTVISLAPSASFVVINGATSIIAPPAGAVAQPTITLGQSVFTPVSGSGSTFVIGDQTLVPGGQPITVAGTILSLAPSASFVMINGVTSTLANVAAAQITAPPVLTIGNGLFRPLPGTGTSYLIGSMILTPGGVVIIADTTISLAPGATALIINGQTSLITPSAQPIITNAPLLTIGSQTYTAVSGTTFVIGGQTLTPGGTITIDGTTISLALGATELIYGSSGRSTTTALFPATTTRSQSVTGTTSASAGASGGNGQAAATSQRKGSASASRVDNMLLVFFASILGLVFA